MGLFVSTTTRMKVAVLLLATLACAGAASLQAPQLRPALLPTHKLPLGLKQLRPAFRPPHRQPRVPLHRDVQTGPGVARQDDPRTIIDTIVAILHALGFTDEDIAEAVVELTHLVEVVIADMSPEEITEVQHALQDILDQVNSGDYNINQVLVDLSIIYTDVYPHLPEDAQAAIDKIVQIIIGILSGGEKVHPRSIIDTIVAILHALGFSDEDIAEAVVELTHLVEVVIADMSPEEITEVQHALQDILDQVNSGDYNINQVL